MKHGTPIHGPVFDWDMAKKAAEHVVGDDGEVNWRAAFAADPGVVRCLGCGEFLWDEAPLMRCECGATCGRETMARGE